MKSLGDDSLPIDVTKDERGQDSYIMRDNCKYNFDLSINLIFLINWFDNLVF